MSVVIETTLGDITVDLFLGERPRACLNFLKLCKIKYYNYNLFHTISRGFIAQTGDPTGSRKGGESLYGVLDGPEKRYFEAENEPRIKHTKMGLISFVGNEDRMIGSQFFITLGDDLTYLDQKHCVFGEVVEGLDILEIINEVICDTEDRPYQDVRITHTVILDDPYPDPKRLKVPSRSPSPTPERLQGGRIAPDEDIDETEGKTAEEVAEVQAEREAKARATILEMVGDLPDAEMAPPENVLFVCKLNPITTDDDLEIIFNRFGKIVSCEVIRDKKTEDSLQYAFIEFEDRKACEDAYFKMDNILIDDRRIHVDFSQSVSKVKWHGKGRGVTHYDDHGKKTNQKSDAIGKGNYKIRNNNRRSRSRSPANNKITKKEDYNKQSSTSNASEISRRNDEKYIPRSPHKDYNKENTSKRSRNGKSYRDKSRSRSRSPRRREESSRRRESKSPRKDRKYRSRSRSPRRSNDRWSRQSNQDRHNYRRGNLSRRGYDDNQRHQSSRTPITTKDRDQSRYDRKSSSTSRHPEKEQKIDRYNDKSNSRDKYKSSENNKNPKRPDSKKAIEKHPKTKINPNSYHKNTAIDSSDNETKEKHSKKKKSAPSRTNQERNKRKKKPKRKESSSESDSESDSESESSESEVEEKKSKNKKNKDSSDSSSDQKSKKKKRKRKPSTESESESESESDDSDSSDSESSESESENEKRKKKKSKKQTRSSSESESSEEEKIRSRKKKKRKN